MSCANITKNIFKAFLKLDEKSVIEVQDNLNSSYCVQDITFVKVYDEKKNLKGSYAVKKFKNAVKGTHCRMFKSEIKMYKNIIPLLNTDISEVLPKIFYSSDPENLIDGESIIVLEDLTTTGFFSLKERYLSIPELEAAMKSIGFYHGEMYSLKLKNLDEFMTSLSKIDYEFYPKTENNFLEFGASLSDTVIIKQLQKLITTHTSEEIVKKAQAILNKVKEEGSLAITRKVREAVEPIAILCHGDFNANNLMFRHNEDGTVECKILDLQLPAYGSPVIDLAFILLMNVLSSEQRRNNLERLIQIYLEEIYKRLKTNMGPDFEIPAYLNSSNILKEFNKVSFVSYFIICFFLPMSQVSFDVLSKEEFPGYAKLSETLHTDSNEKIMITPVTTNVEEVYLSKMYERFCALSKNTDVDKLLFELTEELVNNLPNDSILLL